MGKYARLQYEALQREFPDIIENVTGTGLLYAVKLNKKIFSVVAFDGVEMQLRQLGLGVIHGGDNALRFTPHFYISKEEIDLQVDMLRNFLKMVPVSGFKRLAACDSDSVGSHPVSAPVTLTGHLFDKNVLNNALNAIEEFGAKAKVRKILLGSNTSEESVVQLVLESSRVAYLVQKLEELAEANQCRMSRN